jgi:hypothetical protein
MLQPGRRSCCNLNILWWPLSVGLAERLVRKARRGRRHNILDEDILNKNTGNLLVGITEIFLETNAEKT